MSVTATSRKAYNEHKAAGKLSQQQMDILDALEIGFGFSRSELVEVTGIRLSSVCGRVNEMLQLGVLAELEPRRCTVTGRTVRPVVIKRKGQS
jgi:hypothetical protein